MAQGGGSEAVGARLCREWAWACELTNRTLRHQRQATDGDVGDVPAHAVLAESE